MKKLMPFFILLSIFCCSRNTGVLFEKTNYTDLLEKSKTLEKPIIVDVFSDD